MTGLSNHQFEALQAIGIRVWVPRRVLPLTRDPEPAPLPSSKGHEVASEVSAPEVGRRELEAAQNARVSVPSEQPTEQAAPAYSLRCLSLRGRGGNILIEDEIYAEQSFCRDLLRACHGFEQLIDIRETRFDWPLAGLQDASEQAAKSALSAFLEQDSFVCVRGDGIANLLFGGGRWNSFPETMTFGAAVVWVLGSDVILEDADTRRRLWQAIARMDFG